MCPRDAVYLYKLPMSQVVTTQLMMYLALMIAAAEWWNSQKAPCKRETFKAMSCYILLFCICIKSFFFLRTLSVYPVPQPCACSI